VERLKDDVDNGEAALANIFDEFIKQCRLLVVCLSVELQLIIGEQGFLSTTYLIRILYLYKVV
jgi:hypothetical protein